MIMRLLSSLIALSLVLALTPACSGDSNTNTTPTKVDSGATDAGATDATDNNDTAGGTVDTAAAVDSGPTTTDAGTPGDTGTTGPKDTGSGGGANTSFETAVDIALKSEITKELKPTGAIHYYKFSGTKGQALIFRLQAQTTAFDKDSIDTVLTIFDANKKKLAENDDPLPRVTNDSTILTILPATDVYYVTVQECWTWVEANAPGASCAQPKDKIHTSYTLDVIEIDPTSPNIIPDDEKGNGIDAANAINYAKSTQGGYVLNLLYGTFSSADDIDVYSFTIPKDVPVGKSHAVSYFDFYPSGPDGNGSTSSAGVAWLATAASPTKAIASVDLVQGGSLAPPMALDTPYYLYIPHAGGSAGSNDFYFVNHRNANGNPLEADDVANNKPEGAQSLDATDSSTGGTSFFVEGNLVVAQNDVDHYSIAVPNGATKISVACSAQRSGSGLRDFSVTLTQGDGSSVPGGLALETAKNSALISQIDIPAGATKLIVKVKADKQASGVSSNFYRCGAHVSAG